MMETERTGKFKIYYHNDMDGLCSKVIMEKYIYSKYDRIVNDYIVESYSLNYSSIDAEKIAEIKGDEELVIFVDYSFTENTIGLFTEIVKKTHDGQHLLWIDHHDSSIKFVKDHILYTKPERIINLPSESFIISKSGSGAYLAWACYQSIRFLKMEMDEHTGIRYYTVPDMYDMIRFIPPMVKYVSDYDTFERRFTGTDSFKLFYDMKDDKNVFMNQLFNFRGGWDMLEYTESDSPKYICANLCKDAVNVGKNIKKYITTENAVVIKTQGYKSLIVDPDTGEVTDIYVCNRFSNSWVFGELYDKYRYVVVWYFDGTEFVYSMFSNLKLYPDSHCEKYALAFGGGGHKGAAGWRSKHLMFRTNEFVANEETPIRNGVGKVTAASGCEAQFLTTRL